MRKKKTQKEIKTEREIAAIEVVLRDLALGVNGGYVLDDEYGIVGGLSIEGFGNFLKAVESRFDLGPNIEDQLWSLAHALDFHQFKHFDSFQSMARHLHECGVRE